MKKLLKNNTTKRYSSVLINTINTINFTKFNLIY